VRSTAIRAILLAALAYLLAGLVFGALANGAPSTQIRGAWRLAAWLVSAAVFGAHIVYEQMRRRSTPTVSALCAASAAGLGAFALAVAANVHAQRVGANAHRGALGLSLVLWPLITALPAFVVALVAAALLARLSSGHRAR